MSYLSNTERNIAADLIAQGYQKAADSFSTMAKQKITINPTSIEISKDDLKVIKSIKHDNELILITTSIIGELAGKSYLIFNEEECDAVYAACMPFNEDEYSRMMEGEAILKELDNILSAAVITEFSNYLDVMIFGDVPVLSRSNQAAVKNKVINDFSNDSSNSGYFMIANTQFVFENNTKLQPQFIWKMAEGFMDKVKEVSSKKVAS
ncbi:hypothetical protein [Fulvivirga lutea]|uniref:CheC-like protein domain-containing protein n=1 Tax=Fulvivirga lutea TaxID=2810512 RepID=A0A974WI50_9BACT|nr:hypothetical protein [Fulvivirga lutea]QSE97577.1 hypothetical protein JR347_00370 [Fulvivirga lutea]